jgi:CubicO group peptidase (beta-lactamase class C family)
LNDAIVRHIPELQNHFGATIEELLLYRLRGQQMSLLKDLTCEEIRRTVFQRGFVEPAGQSIYTNRPAFLLGIILCRVGGDNLPTLARNYLFGQLGMHDTVFFPNDLARIAPTEVMEGEEIRGIVHDERARVFARKQRAVGHAGLFSTARDLLNFLDALLRGTFPPVVELAERGLGWHPNSPWFMGRFCGERTFGKTGFTGTSVFVDMERSFGLLILSNRTYAKRPHDASSLLSAINSFRADVADILLN